jgi:CheY-like chemotaxis protein
VTHVLVVDDDAHILRTLRIHLAGHGYSVATAETGQDAIRIAASDRPDLVVLDLGLPDIDGTAVISALRRDSTVPIIVLSARTDAPDKVDALDTGADDYVTKPFGIAERGCPSSRGTSGGGPPPESCRSVGTRVNRQEHHEEGDRRAEDLPERGDRHEPAGRAGDGERGPGRADR